jgi:hypothetical protein
MGYKLLGVVVWKGAKWFVRRKYGDRPRNVLSGTAVAGALAMGVVLALRGNGSD